MIECGSALLGKRETVSTTAFASKGRIYPKLRAPKRIERHGILHDIEYLASILSE
jgi:hypothetical protein